MSTKLLDYTRYALYAIMVVIAFLLIQYWNIEHPKEKNATVVTQNTQSYVPQIATTSNQTTITPATTTIPVTTKQQLIHITTDVINATIDTVGGNVVEVQLLKYPEQLHSDKPILLFNNSPESRYLAQSGLLSTEGPDTQKGQATYTTDKTDYSIAPGQDQVQVILHWQNAAGIRVDKLFTFKRNQYDIDLNYQITNQSQSNWHGNLYSQLMRTNTPPANTQGFVSFATYFGAAISTPEKRFQKIPFKDMTQNNLNQTVTGGWVAMIQHYFVSAWVPDSTITSQYFTQVTPDGLYTVGMLGPNMEIAPGQSMNTHAKLYAGPAIANDLEKAAPGLKLTIDYGWFWFISAIIFWMMQHIYNFVGNWGWSIVIVTLIIKLMFYPLSAKSYRSMSGLKKLQPKLTALKERFGEDKQKFTQATLELYKKEKVNPMSGCLPILIQIPVFIGLYWVLIESVQLRQAPFILWIHDLSIMDPYYVLPVLMGLSMFLQQRLNPPPADPMQAKVMMFMPIVFTFLFVKFPAGLMLYWFVNNTVSFLQQWFIMRSLDKAEKVKKLQK